MILNHHQENVVRHREGIICIDAGPGTGKTHTITHRYLQMIRDGIDPNDVLLLTFTDNAASEMRERVVDSLADEGLSMSAERMHISTFHSFCARLLRDGGGDATRCLGIDGVLSESFSIIADEGVEEAFVYRCLADFAKNDDGRHGRMLSLLDGAHEDLGKVIAKLLSKGVAPTIDGWFMDGEAALAGNREAMISMAKTMNAPGQGARGPVRSHLKERMFRSKRVFYDPPHVTSADKSLPWDMVISAIDEDRSEIGSFIHDLYLHMLRAALEGGALTFGMLIMLAFLKLAEDEEFRHRHQFKYVMVDEFQDTNELQFMLCLLLLRQPNLCVVGDWRQGIYGFRHATIDNLADFASRLHELVGRLRDQGIGGIPNFENVWPIRLLDSYRSSESLKNMAELTLLSPMKDDDENGMTQRLDGLRSLNTCDTRLDASTSISFLQYADRNEEMEGVLDTITGMMEAGMEILIKDEFRPLALGDIGVLCRKRSFALRLQELARKKGLPLEFDGGSELLNTPEAKILLAWLRVLVDPRDKRGWAPIMLRDGMPPSLVKDCLKGDIPEHLRCQRERLTRIRNGVAMLTAEVYRFEQIENANSMAMVDRVDKLYRDRSMGLPELVRLLDRNLRARTKYNIGADASQDVVRVQTIHGAKGLQYPVVILADCNKYCFPPKASDRSMLLFDDTIGLRCTKVLGEVNGLVYRFDSWRTRLSRQLTTKDMDEERRLLYVAVTRARQHLVVTCHDPAPLVGHLCPEGPISAVAIKRMMDIQPESDIGSPPLVLPPAHETMMLSPHDLMPEVHGDPGGRGKAFGLRIHQQAELLARGLDVESDLHEMEVLRKFLHRNQGMRLMPELDMSIDLDGILVSGRADLVLMGDEKMVVVDHKTDLTMANQEAYRVQMSVYLHALASATGLPVKAVLLYLSLGEERWIEPLTRAQLVTLAHGCVQNRGS